jgi:hypothetical protein
VEAARELGDLSPMELVLFSLLALFALALTAIAVTSLWWMPHAWRTPASLLATGFPTGNTPPRHSFSLIVPARHEEAVLGATLERLAGSHHPQFEVLAVVGDDDPDTRAVAPVAAGSSHRAGPSRPGHPAAAPGHRCLRHPGCHGPATRLPADPADDRHAALRQPARAGNVPRNARLLVDDALWVDLVEQGYPPGQVIWFYKLETDRDIQGRYPRGWREFDYLVSTATLRSFPDNLPQARESRRRSRVVASFGRGAQRVEIRKVQGPPL